jgi:hypothetical protein
MFKQWCKSQNFSNANNLSHVLLDGGKLSVPFDKLNEFYEKYIEAVKSGEKLYVVEQKTEKYNFFVDIDYKSKDPLGIDDIKDICKIICDQVKKHSQEECLISIALPKVCGSLVKTGVHMNWLGLVVDQVSAIALREHILVALTTSRPGQDWNEIIDSSVYGSAVRKTKGSGFRMPWSFKKAKHDTCGGQGCDGCTSGKIDQVEYLPLFIYTKQPFSTLLRIDQEPSVKILKMSAIRTDAPESVKIEPPSVGVKEGSFSKDQTKDEIYDQELKDMVEIFIRKNMDGQGDAYITKVFKHRDTFLVSTTSKYCENLKRNHNSNHVWFIISGNVILQKCFCRCETIQGRRDGFCKDFCGRQHELSQGIVDKLYPNKGVLNKCREIKKFEEKPQLKQSDVTPPLEKFIRTAFIKSQDDDTRVVSITRDKKNFIILTTSHYCETIGKNHEDKAMSYIIKNNIISQKCPVCKKSKSREHILTNNVLKVLKQ